MLLFAESGSPLPGITAFPDHLEERVLHVLPAALRAVATPDGDPDFFVLRYHGDFATASGGLLHLRLELEPPPVSGEDGREIRQVGFDGGRFRLVLRSLLEGDDAEAGDWHPVSLAGREVAAPAVGLTPQEAQILETLLADGRSVVEVEVELGYRGLVPGMPWLVTADAAALAAQLAALLPAAPVRADGVVAAFLSLSAGDAAPLRWRPLADGAEEPSRDAILAETALRALDRLFVREPDEEPLYRLREDAAAGAATISWDLAPPRQERRRHTLSWSVSELHARLTDEAARRRVFPVVTQVSPFAAVDVHVLNQVPFDPGYLRKVVVDVRYTGEAGVPEFRSFVFDGGPDVARFSTFYPAASIPFTLDYRLTATLAPPNGTGWPVVQKGGWIRAAGLVVEASRRTLGLDFVRLEAEPAVFEKAAAVDITLTDGPETPPLALLSLTAARPGVWVALPGQDPAAPLAARAEARALADGLPPCLLREGPLAGRELKVSAYQLEVLEPDRITIELDPEAAPRFAYVAVTVAPLGGEPRMHTLNPGEPWVWSFFRSSVFDPIRFRYRLDYVAFGADHATRPLASTDWSVAEGSALLVRPPEGSPEPL
ncbi:MAG TPA: hypothetical protein VLT87_25825 [Thermoanaerobaculia bacterium]|nr:hypothetical protein [Thermoanaerobaculia bacterium]